MPTIGPQTAGADRIHAMKYRGDGEDFREAMNRVAFGLKDTDAHYHELRDILLHQRFLPGGRIQGAIGATRITTPYNCFVSGTIADSFVEDDGSIMDRAKEAAATMRMGGGIGYDFSTLRPKGDLIRKLQSQSSGAVSFMQIFNAVCLATSSSGHRRGAQMGVLRVDHPDIEAFVRAKQNATELRGFNLSIGITNEFMEAALAGRDFDLRFGGQTYRTIDAAALWELIMRSTWDWAEPGVIFIDTVNEQNNLWYCETIAATNPCGEQPLPPFGACLLGSWNLVKYLIRQRTFPRVVAGAAPVEAVEYSFDTEAMLADVPAIVRAMDNVVDRARYPMAEQKAEAITKRRMGLGVTGLANAGEACAVNGHLYGTPGFLAFEDHVLSTLKRACYLASIELAREKGAFPLYDERYLKGRFVRRLDDDVRDGIARHGIRNSHLTSIAPTGTISISADNVSSGLEPVFEYVSRRPINTPEGPVEYDFLDYGHSVLGVNGKLTSQVTAEEHVNVLTTAQRHIDSAVSKTCNVAPDMPWADFKDLYRRAWEGGAKGCTTFNLGGKRGALLTAGEQGEVCQIDPDTGRRECA